MPDAPAVTVLRDRYVPSPEALGEGEGYPADAVHAVPLGKALERHWSSDAHLTAYAPVAVPRTDEPGELHVRLASGAIGHVPIEMVALIGDVDDPEAHANGAPASDAWRAAVEPRLEASGLAWYRTRGGARVVAELDEPFAIREPADAQEWRTRYAAWRKHIATHHGVTLDEHCSDWTRLYRLPNVERAEHGTQRAPVHGRPPRVTLPAASAEAIAAPREAPAPRPIADANAGTRAAIGAMLATLGPASDHDGAKHSLCLALGGVCRKAWWSRDDCAALVRAWLGPIAGPTVDVDAGVRAALRAWDRDAAEVSGESYLAGIVGSDAARAIVEGAMLPGRARRHALDEHPADTNAAADGDDPWLAHDWHAPERVVPYTCRGLCLAPSRGKISIIAGQPGAGKGPIANHIAVCYALGLPAFGQHACDRLNVLLLDYEGTLLTTRRCARLTRAVGREPRELAGRLHVLDATRLGALTQTHVLERFGAYVAAHDVGVVVLDSYTSAALTAGIEMNSPEFGAIAQSLGTLDRTVIAVAHANKAAADSREPRLADIAYSGTFASLAQTAIVVHYPDAADRYTIRLGCARAPERRFERQDVHFTDGADGTLECTWRGEVREAPEGGAVAPAAGPRLDGTRAAARRAGERILAALRTAETPSAGAAALADTGGEGPAAGKRALALLVEGGLLKHCLSARTYELTDAGRDADPTAVASALGRQAGGFERG